MHLIEELQWRGMIQDIIPDTDKHFKENKVTAYVGFDPTADSLHVGHLVSIMLLKHLEKHGHKAMALIGGATGMIGDPSGKSKERNLLEKNTIDFNVECLVKQFKHLLSSESQIVNNKSWFQNINFLDFIRDIGKHIPVSYMMNKASVKSRIDSEQGMSFTEFTYQLVQGYDFLHLFEQYECTTQIGGSDQWGNMTTGTELIRKVNGGNAFGFTCPLLTKENGEKFGKTESGAIWLDSNKTSPYKFFQFWLNVKDDDAEKYIKIFTTIEKDAIEEIISQHNENRGKKKLQRLLAMEVTTMVHSRFLANQAEKSSKILFGDNTIDMLDIIGDKLFDEVLEGIDRFEIKKGTQNDVSFLDLFTSGTNFKFFKSKRELRDLLGSNAISINDKKVNLDSNIDDFDILRGNKFLIKRGKKKFFLLELV